MLKLYVRWQMLPPWIRGALIFGAACAAALIAGAIVNYTD